MRALWILSLFSVLMSMGLVMVILGQHREMDIISKKSEELEKNAEQFYIKLQNEEQLKASFQNLYTQGGAASKDLENQVASLTSELESKKQESDACQAELKTQKEEVESIESTLTKNTEDDKADAEKWKGEIDHLKAQLAEHSKICDYVAVDKRPAEFCGNKTSEKVQ